MHLFLICKGKENRKRKTNSNVKRMQLSLAWSGKIENIQLTAVLSEKIHC